MNDLPWLVVHGALVWKAALVLFSCGGAALALRIARGVARRAAEEARGSLGKERDRIDPADLGTQVTLVGDLDVGDDRCARFDDGASAAAASAAVGDVSVNVRAPELRITVGGSIVTLEGPVDVIAGSREDRPKRTLEQLGGPIRARVVQAGSLPWYERTIAFRSLDRGDRVIARGVLRRAEGVDEGQGYRASAGGFKLTPAPRKSGEAIALAAAGAPRLARPVTLFGTGVAVGCAAFIAVFVSGGDVAGRIAGGAGSMARMSIWAATPHRREEAIADFTAPLEQADVLDGKDLDRLVELDLLLERCDRAVQALGERGRFARAMELAEACGDKAAAARAAFEGGIFTKSSADADVALNRGGFEVLTDDVDEPLCMARAHLFAGEFGRAAREVRRAWRAIPIAGVPDERTLDCVADALEARGAGAQAAQQLFTKHQAGINAECALVIADLLEPNGAEGRARARMLERFSEEMLRARGQTIFNVGSLLDAEMDPDSRGLPARITTPSPDRVLPVPTGGVDYIVMGTAGAILDRLAADPSPSPARQRLRAVLAASRSVFDASTASWDESRRWAALAARDVETISAPEDADLRKRILGVLAAVPLRYPVPEPGLGDGGAGYPAFQAMAAIIRHRVASQIDAPALNPMLDASAKRQMASALAGDSRRLLRTLEEDLPFGPAIRLIHIGDADPMRPELDRWLSGGRVKRSRKCDIKSRLADLEARLSLAEAVGSSARGEIGAQLAAFRAGLLRRDVNVPLAILDSLAPGRP